MKIHVTKILRLTLRVFIVIVTLHALIATYNSPSRKNIARWIRDFSDSVSYSFQLTFGCSDRPKCYYRIAQNIARKKRNAKAGRSLYFLDPDYVPPTEVTIPEYFNPERKPAVQKPVVQVFDPRFTLSVYYEWISKNPGSPVPFHWSDWTNLGILHNYIFSQKKSDNTCKKLFELSKDSNSDNILPVDSYCTDAKDFPLGYKITGLPGPQTKYNAMLIAKSYLFSGFAAPSRLVFLTNSHGAFTVDEANEENDLKYSLLRNGMPEDVYTYKRKPKLDVLKSYNSLLRSSAPRNSPAPEPSLLHLEGSYFDMDIDQVIQDMHQSELTKQEKKYLDSIEYSHSTKSPAKGLFEADILSSEERNFLGKHYDWRFFERFSSGSHEQAMALHGMVRTFLKFCRIHGLVTWISHGSLLSWYWNGLAFPWDLDADVQMPIRDLHRLAREFNQTLVLENAGHDLPRRDTKMVFNGMGAYFVHVGSSITHRNVGNGLNRIDARFIDIHTGLYVDITALAVSEETPAGNYAKYPSDITKEQRKEMNKANNFYNCRNTMWASLEEISPLTKAVVDNEIGYVPHNFQSLLTQEYKPKSMVLVHDSGYEFVETLRFWMKTKIRTNYLEHPQNWIHEKSEFPQQGLDARGLYPDQDTENLLYDEEILREFASTQEFTAFHVSQREHLKADRKRKYFKDLAKYKRHPNLGKALWDDPFMRKIAMGEWDRDVEMRRIDSS